MISKNITKLLLIVIVLIAVILLTNNYSLYLVNGILLLLMMIISFVYHDIMIGIFLMLFIIGFILYNSYFMPKENVKEKKVDKAYLENINYDIENDYRPEEIELSNQNSSLEIDNENIIVESMSNKMRNSGIDRISAENNIRSKQSNCLMITKNNSNNEPKPYQK